MTFNLFGLLNKPDTVTISNDKKQDQLVISNDVYSYSIESSWGGFEWNIFLIRRRLKDNHYTIIKSYYDKSNKQRDYYISDLKLNKSKYIQDYESKEKQKIIIPL
jgi:hypothetical protein